MRAARLTPSGLARSTPQELTGAILLEPVRASGWAMAKGQSLDQDAAARLVAAAATGTLTRLVKIAWPEAGDVHEDEAAAQLARAVGGAGVGLRSPRLSRFEPAAMWDDVLHLRIEPLHRLNGNDPREVVTVFPREAVAKGQVVCAVKVTRHLLPVASLAEGLRTARMDGPLVEVQPYRDMKVGEIAVQAITPDALERFEQ